MIKSTGYENPMILNKCYVNLEKENKNLKGKIDNLTTIITELNATIAEYEKEAKADKNQMIPKITIEEVSEPKTNAILSELMLTDNTNNTITTYNLEISATQTAGGTTEEILSGQFSLILDDEEAGTIKTDGEPYKIDVVGGATSISTLFTYDAKKLILYDNNGEELFTSEHIEAAKTENGYTVEYTEGTGEEASTTTITIKINNRHT